jgi:magnesium chelatase family protein
MLARRLTTILPAMRLAEALATTHIHRVAGLTGARTTVVTTRPCRAPHHTISDVGLIGGGQVPMPGDVSVAHNGVLFLDELPECRRPVLEVLRQPLENGVIYIQSHGRAQSQYSCDFSGTAIDLQGLGASLVALHDCHQPYNQGVLPRPSSL